MISSNFRESWERYVTFLKLHKSLYFCTKFKVSSVILAGSKVEEDVEFLTYHPGRMVKIELALEMVPKNVTSSIR